MALKIPKIATQIKNAISSNNALSSVIKPEMVSNVTSKLPLGGKAADAINQAVSGITNQDLLAGAQRGLDFAQNINLPEIDVSTGLPKKLPSIGGDISIFDPLAQGIKSAYGGVKDFFSGGKEEDIRNAQAEYEAIQRGEQPLSIQDKLIRETKRIGGQIGGGLDTLKEAAAQNKALLNMGIQGSAAYAGYQAGKGAREQVGGLLGQQLQEMQGVGGKFQGIEYDPQRYAEQQQFLRDRIAGGGYTAEEKQMQQQGDVRGARASAAARLAGIEDILRRSPTATGSGAALAASLAGGQAMGNIQAETEQARQASGIGKKEAAIGQQAQILRQKTAEEADLAKQQADVALQRQKEIGSVRSQQGQNILDTATQEAGFYGKLAELGTNVLTGLETETERKERENRQAIQDENTRAETAALNAQAALNKKRLLGMDTSAEEQQLAEANRRKDIIKQNTQAITQPPKQAPVDGTKTPNYVMQKPQATTTQTTTPAAKPPTQTAPPAVKTNLANPVNTQVKQVGSQLNKPLPATKQTEAQKFNAQNQTQQAKFR